MLAHTISQSSAYRACGFGSNNCTTSETASKRGYIADALDLVENTGSHFILFIISGVRFLYECVMGMRKHEGQGCILADEM